MGALDMIDSWPADNAAAGWVERSGRCERKGSTDRVFALASVTKTLFAYAVLVAVEEGTLTLDDPVDAHGHYRDRTVRQLLSHASGMPPEPGGPIAEPEARRIYSNAGFELAGEALAASSGMSVARYVDLAVCQPLGLAATSIGDSPAHGGHSTVDDLITVLAEWLSPTLIHPDTMREATTAQFPDLAGVLPGYGRAVPNPWGLGFELRGTKSPHWSGSANSPETFGHFGRSGTLLWVDPVAGRAAVALTDHAFGQWAIDAWPRFSDAVLDAA